MSEQRTDADQVHAHAYELLVTGWLLCPAAAGLSQTAVPVHLLGG